MLKFSGAGVNCALNLFQWRGAVKLSGCKKKSHWVKKMGFSKYFLDEFVVLISNFKSY